jgi:hypothetical protein
MTDDTSLPLGIWTIETMRADGTWQRFTVEPLLDEEEAKQHLGLVVEAAREHGLSPDRIRRRELTDEDMVDLLTPKERDQLALLHARSLPMSPRDFWLQRWLAAAKFPDWFLPPT